MTSPDTSSGHNPSQPLRDWRRRSLRHQIAFPAAKPMTRRACACAFVRQRLRCPMSRGSRRPSLPSALDLELPGGSPGGRTSATSGTEQTNRPRLFASLQHLSGGLEPSPPSRRARRQRHGAGHDVTTGLRGERGSNGVALTAGGMVWRDSARDQAAHVSGSRDELRGNGQGPPLDLTAELNGRNNSGQFRPRAPGTEPRGHRTLHQAPSRDASAPKLGDMRIVRVLATSHVRQGHEGRLVVAQTMVEARSSGEAALAWPSGPCRGRQTTRDRLEPDADMAPSRLLPSRSRARYSLGRRRGLTRKRRPNSWPAWSRCALAKPAPAELTDQLKALVAAIWPSDDKRMRFFPWTSSVTRNRSSLCCALRMSYLSLCLISPSHKPTLIP